MSIVIMSLLVRMFLKRWKFNDNGLVKFFNMLIGSKIGVGCIYFLKYFNFFFFNFV